jgi:hypothetical protein
MSHPHKGLPEIISAFEKKGQYFGIVSLAISGVKKKYEFEVDEASYLAIKRLVSMKPYGRKRELKYHYYFAPGAERTDEASRTFCQVRIEREDQGKEFEIEAPEALIAELTRFNQVKDLKELSHLREFK